MNRILTYFDLNKRAYSEQIVLSHYVSPQIIIEEPSIFSGEFSSQSQKAKQPLIPLWKQLIFYLGTCAGVLLSSSIMQLQTGKIASTNLTVWAAILSAIIALVIMPHVYEKAVKPDAPFIVQLGLFVQEGVFWSVLLTSIGKAFG